MYVHGEHNPADIFQHTHEALSILDVQFHSGRHGHQTAVHA